MRLFDFEQLFPDCLERLEDTQVARHGRALCGDFLCRPVKCHALLLHQKMNLLESLDIGSHKLPVTLRISLRPDEPRKRIGPESDERNGLSDDVRNLSYGIE